MCKSVKSLLVKNICSTVVVPATNIRVEMDISQNLGQISSFVQSKISYFPHIFGKTKINFANLVSKIQKRIGIQILKSQSCCENNTCITMASAKYVNIFVILKGFAVEAFGRLFAFHKSAF